MRFEGEKIYLRFLEVTDAEELLALYIRNKDFFQKYSILRQEEYYTLEFQIENIKKQAVLREKDEAYSFGIFIKDTNELVGVIALSMVIRSSLNSCNLGYSLDMQHNGNGYMSEAAQLIVKFAFEELHLHRIEAGAMPHNKGSIRVLEKAGFHKEGIAEKNVNINGKWQDHQVMAIVNPID